jgi:hypothetical protein
MKAIVLPDDLLRHLEMRFGHLVRRTDSWNSDRNFGYPGVPIVAVEEASEALDNPDLILALFRLDCMPEQTGPLIELLETFGPGLIGKIIAAYTELSLS